MTNLMRLLLQISITASAMILVVMAIRAMLAKRMNPIIVLALWTVVLARLCIPVMIESSVNIASIIPKQPIQQVSEASETTSVHEQPAQKDTTLVTDTYEPMDTGQLTERYSPPQGQPQTTSPQSLRGYIDRVPWWSILSAVWITGAAIVLGAAARNYIMFKRRLRKCKQTTDETITSIINQYKRELGVKKKVKVIECSDIKTPAVFGYYSPTILLPAEFTSNMDDYAVRCILLHEMCHIKRRDILKSYAWLVAKALHWFNPLVWIAYKMFKDDTELCCDQMVLSQLSENRKYEYTQSLIDVFRMAKQTEIMSLTISLFENKTKLVERVMRMLKPERKSKTAVGISFMLIAVMIVACFTTACQPIEKIEEEIIDEKASTKVQEDTQSSSPVTEDEIEEKTITYEAPEHWTESFTQDSSIIKVNIDADIIIPNAEKFSIYEVAPKAKISQAMADKLMEVFFGDTPAYEKAPPSIEDLNRWFTIIQNEYTAMKDGTFDYSRYDISSDRPNRESTAMNQTKRYIYSLEHQINEYTESDNVPMNTALATEGEISGSADLGEVELATLKIRNDDNYTSVFFENDGSYTTTCKDTVKDSSLPGLSISEQEAINRAKDLLAKLGLEDYENVALSITRRSICPKYEDILDDKYAYRIIFTPSVDGISLSRRIASYQQDENMVAEQAEWLTPECIVITVDDRGIRRFYWQTPCDIKHENSKDAELLPFNEIKDIIATYPFEKYNYVGSYDLTDENASHYRVTDAFIKNVYCIKLEMARMPVDGNMEEQQLVPVWNVYSTSEMHGRLRDSDGNIVNVVEQFDELDIMLTINAINGDVI